MKPDSIEQQMQQLSRMGMTDVERAVMRRTLLGYVRLHPSRAPLLAFFMRHAMATLGLIGVLLASGTTVLADRALPGGALYPVRVAVNDRLAVAFAGDAYDRIEKELNQIGKALDEEASAAAANLEMLGEDDDLREPNPSTAADVMGDVELESDLRDIDRLLKELEAELEAELFL